MGWHDPDRARDSRDVSQSAKPLGLGAWNWNLLVPHGVAARSRRKTQVLKAYPSKISIIAKDPARAKAADESGTVNRQQVSLYAMQGAQSLSSNLFRSPC